MTIAVMKKPILSFTVKLSKWRCGASNSRTDNKLGEGPTYLLNDLGYKCCLGFACQDAGYKKALKNIATPACLKAVIPGLTLKVDGLVQNSTFTDEAIKINDSFGTSVTEKKDRLITLGLNHDIRIKFIP